MKDYYFFKSKEGLMYDNYDDNIGISYPVAGLVESVHLKNGYANRSGKDLSVTYVDPFTGEVISGWEAINEVDLIKVPQWRWEMLQEQLTNLIKTCK